MNRPGNIPQISATLIVVAGILLALNWRGSMEPRIFVQDDATVSTTPSAKPLYESRFIFPDSVTPYAHASTLLELPDGGILCAWYGGAREGAEDTRIYIARYHPESRQWQEPAGIVHRYDVAQATGRYIRKLGNPVLARGTDNSIRLFFVSVSVGGWSGSALNVMTSLDDGASWTPPRRLVTSPFLNVSTLVKGQPLYYQDGVLGLPVYHELAGKFGELLFLDKNNELIRKTRMSYGRQTLQPSVAPLDNNKALALFRYAGHRPKHIVGAVSEDGGVSWLETEKISLPNPNAAVMVRNSPSGLLLVFNNTRSGRYDLSLARSGDDGRTWDIIHRFEYAPDAATEQRFSYPFLIRARNGIYHLTYTWNKHRIRHIQFNDAWVRSRKVITP